MNTVNNPQKGLEHLECMIGLLKCKFKIWESNKAILLY